jgi:hypothetical protein
VDVHAKLDEAIAVVTQARSVPMSASCLVHRKEFIQALDEVRTALPVEFAMAESVLRDRDEVIEAGRQEAAVIIATAQEESNQLVAESAIYHRAMSEAAAVRQAAEDEATALRREVDDYVDTKLANFEIALNKTLAAVHRGRDKLHGRQSLDEATLDEESEVPLPS